MVSAFKQYIEHGWVLVPIPPGRKGPNTKGWQLKKNGVTDPDREMRSAGLAHAYSGTCAIDVDEYGRASEWLAERGVDLEALFNAPDAVQLSSGRVGRGKLIYQLPGPLCSKKVALFGNNQSALDFRCATAAGLTVQDVLPPSIHPDTGEAYKWIYDELFGGWQDLPLIPDALHQIWLAELDASARGDDIPDKGASIEELRALLVYHDPDMNRDEWVAVGMAIHHETNGDLAGLDLWDEWSKGSDKYTGRGDLEAPWRSFHDTSNAITVGSLRQGATASPDEFPDVTETPEGDDPWAAVAAQRKARFQLTHVSEIAQRPPPQWIVEDLLPEADLAMMIGPPGAGKSFAALDLAFSVSTGFTWFNKKVKNPGPVVWVAAEAVGAMRNRARAYGQARGVKLETTDLHILEETFSLMDGEDATAATEALTEVKPRLIIVDTLAAASGGANENSGEDMNRVLDNCRKMHAATGALVLLIHHVGKDASRGARGWSGLHAAVRAEFSVTHSPDSPIRVLCVTKQSDGIEGEKLAFKLQTVTLDMDENITSCVVEPLDEAMLDPNTAPKLGRDQKLVFKTIYDLIGELSEEGAAIFIQDVYDAVLIQIPPPPEGKRDRRSEIIQRALRGLHERGFITINDGSVSLGSAFNGDEDIPLSEM